MNREKESFFSSFFKQESAGGILLMVSAVLALIFANSPLEKFYNLFLTTPFEIRLGSLGLSKPLLLWINDGLMAIFFFLVGLELKRELVEGELSDKKNIILPGLGAVGGMAIPALIYLFFNFNDPVAQKGWAIPAATDIAFALGVLSLLGKRVPASIKIFLTSLAIFDDIGAIVIIALFYTSNISLLALVVVVACILVLTLLNKKAVTAKSVYLLVGLIMWVAMLKSGVHATLAGVVLAMFIPLKSSTNPSESPLKSLEHDLHAVVAFFVLPVFGFANAGINFSGVTFNQLFHHVPLGIAAGLFLGKQVGIFTICWLAIKLNITSLPQNISWAGLYGTAVLCGIGFTMSLFIGSLAFANLDTTLLFDERFGIILGSLLSGIVGYLILHFSLKSDSVVTDG